MKKILILVDYRSQFWLTVRHKQASFKLDRVVEEFEKLGFSAEISNFSDVDLLNRDFSGMYVIYQSTEDPMLLYNDYITDVLLALQKKGAILIPDFYCFRAHHNKVFMEMLRTMSPLPEIRSISSRWFGAFPEYLKYTETKDCIFPQVVKLSEGSGSHNVILIHNKSEINKVKCLMWYKDIKFQIKDFIKSLWKSRYPNFRAQTNARRKIIVQNFIPGLTGDYKVLAFGNNFYVLHRDVRSNDFRASGSGLFKFPEQVSEKLLDFAEKVYRSFNVPMISMDIAETETQCHLIEFQFVAFGTYTIEKALFHFTKENGKWKKENGVQDLETEFAQSIASFIAQEGN